jgi:hypothetical protein
MVYDWKLMILGHLTLYVNENIPAFTFFGQAIFQKINDLARSQIQNWETRAAFCPAAGLFSLASVNSQMP